MALETVASSQPDITAIVTSLGIFSLAIASLVAGIWKAVKNIKSEETVSTRAVAGAVLVETTTLVMLTESNRRLAEQIEGVDGILRALERLGHDMLEAMRDERNAIRSNTEEAHRLRLAVRDLHEYMRTRQ